MRRVGPELWGGDGSGRYPLRILMLNHNVVWRGAFQRAYGYSRELARRGHRVTLMTISPTRRAGFEVSHDDGLRIVKTPDLLSGRLRSGWDPWDAAARIAYGWRGGYDLIHSVDSRPVCIVPALILRDRHGCKLILDWGDWWAGGTIEERRQGRLLRALAPLEVFFEERFRRYADGTMVLTRALEQRALDLGVKPDRMIRLPPGTDVERIRPLDRMQCRNELGLPAEARLLGYLGSILPGDGRLLVESLRRLFLTDPDVMLLVIGNSNLEVPVELMRTGRVLRTGGLRYERLNTFLGACDAMLLPLRDCVANRGRWPSKFGDYLAAGRPVVTCAVGDLAPFVLEALCGVLSADDPRSFAESVRELLARPDLEQMGKAARSVAETQLRWEVLTDELESLYFRICGARG